MGNKIKEIMRYYSLYKLGIGDELDSYKYIYELLNSKPFKNPLTKSVYYGVTKDNVIYTQSNRNENFTYIKQKVWSTICEDFTLGSDECPIFIKSIIPKKYRIDETNIGIGVNWDYDDIVSENLIDL